MKSVFKWLCMMAIGMLIASCGGGSSSGGGASGGAIETDTISISRSSIEFVSTQFEDIPSPISVTATIRGSNTAGIVFGTLPGVAGLPDWLDFQSGSFVNNALSAEFLITRTDLIPGDYNFTVRAASFDSNENVLDTIDLQIQYRVNEGIPLSVSPESVDVVMHFASEPIGQTISITAGNYDWSVFSSDANLSSDTGNGNQDIDIQILPPMPEMVDVDGNYQGAVDVAQTNFSNQTIFLINYKVFPTLSGQLSEATSFTAVAGTNSNRQMGINLFGEGLEWDASANVNWIQFSNISGTINTSDELIDPPEGDDLSFSIDATGLSSGRYEGVITLTAAAEQTLEIPVVVEVAAQRLSVSQYGVSFVEVPEFSRLETSINVRSNVNSVKNWTASSNAAWLTVTPSGTTDNNLIITANPTVLADEVTSFAQITLSSPDNEISDTEIINVGFWKSSQSTSNAPVTISGNFSSEYKIISDPIRPLVYVRTAGDKLSVINVYSADLETTLTTPRNYRNFDISDDGTFLYLISSGDDEGFIDVLDLTSLSFVNQWSYAVDRITPSDNQSLTFSRLAGRPFLLTSTQKIIDASNGQDFGNFAINRDPNSFFSILDFNRNVVCARANFLDYLLCYDFFYGGFEGASVIPSQRGGDEPFDTNLREINLSSDGEKIYMHDGGSLSVAETNNLLDSQPFLPQENGARIEEFEIDTNGNIVVSVISTTEIDMMPEQSRSFVKYNPQGELVFSVAYPSFGGILDSLLDDCSISGDNKRLICVSESAEGLAEFFSLE